MESIDLSAAALLFLFAAALLAGFVDTLVGGGGLISLPALMLAGVPPVAALGTNKLQGVMGTATASILMFKHRRVTFNVVWRLMLTAFIGAACGAVAIQFFDASLLEVVIPTVLVVIALYFLIAPGQVLQASEPRVSSARYTAAVIPSIGFYDGMFGPGTGSFFVFAGVSLRGQQIIQATAVAKPLNLATNLASLMVFATFGKVLWAIGGVMMLGQLIGAHLGSHALFRINPAHLRYLVIVVCVVILSVWFGNR